MEIFNPGFIDLVKNYGLPIVILAMVLYYLVKYMVKKDSIILEKDQQIRKIHDQHKEDLRLNNEVLKKVTEQYAESIKHFSKIKSKLDYDN